MTRRVIPLVCMALVAFGEAYADRSFSFSSTNPPDSINPPVDGFNGGDTNVFIRPDGTASLPLDFGVYDSFGSLASPTGAITAFGVLTLLGYPQSIVFSVPLATNQSTYSTTVDFDLASMNNAHTNTTPQLGILTLAVSGSSITSASINVTLHPHGRFFSFSHARPPNPSAQPVDGFNGGDTNLYIAPDGTAVVPVDFGIFGDAGALSPPHSNMMAFAVLTIFGHPQSILLSEPMSTTSAIYSSTATFDLAGMANAHTNLVPIQGLVSLSVSGFSITTAVINVAIHPHARFFSHSAIRAPDASNAPVDGFQFGDTNVFLHPDGSAAVPLTFGLFGPDGALSVPHTNTTSASGVLTVFGYAQQLTFSETLVRTQSAYATNVEIDLQAIGAHTNEVPLAAIHSIVAPGQVITSSQINIVLYPFERMFSFSTNAPPGSAQAIAGFNGGITNVYLTEDGIARLPIAYGVYDVLGQRRPPSTNESAEIQLLVPGWPDHQLDVPPLNPAESAYTRTLKVTLPTGGDSDITDLTQPFNAVIRLSSFGGAGTTDTFSVDVRCFPLGSEGPPMEFSRTNSDVRIAWQLGLDTDWVLDRATNLLAPPAWQLIDSDSIRPINGRLVFEPGPAEPDVASYRLRYVGP